MENLSLLPLSPKAKQLYKAVVELNTLNNEHKLNEEHYKKRKDELQGFINGYIEKRKISGFGFQDGKSFFTAKPIINKKIIWDIDKLSKKVDKEILNEVVDKTYTINDFDGLVEYLKSCGVNPKVFKKFINVKKEVNNKKVDELGHLGEINIKKLTGCYELQANFSYIKITEECDEENPS